MKEDPCRPLKDDHSGIVHTVWFDKRDALPKSSPYVGAVRCLLKENGYDFSMLYQPGAKVSSWSYLTGYNGWSSSIFSDRVGQEKRQQSLPLPKIENSLIVIDNILVSEDVVDKQFVCDLGKCKGGCCEDGAAGAPLEKEELKIIKEVYEKVRPYLTKDSIAEIEKKGYYVYDKEFEWVTPTLDNDNEICVYGVRGEKGIIMCAFEQAYNDKVIPWKKPVSCHLYPITTKRGKHGEYERVNYEPREQMCSPACALGEKLKVPVYQFLKEPLVRKYGEEFYNALDTIAKGEWEEIDPSDIGINEQPE